VPQSQFRAVKLYFTGSAYKVITIPLKTNYVSFFNYALFFYLVATGLLSFQLQIWLLQKSRLFGGKNKLFGRFIEGGCDTFCENSGKPQLSYTCARNFSRRGSAK
jgi:hypothetical protein